MTFLGRVPSEESIEANRMITALTTRLQTEVSGIMEEAAKAIEGTDLHLHVGPHSPEYLVREEPLDEVHLIVRLTFRVCRDDHTEGVTDATTEDHPGYSEGYRAGR